MTAVLEVRGLRTQVAARSGPLDILRGVDLTVDAGQTLAVVGESGSGKSFTALSIAGLLPPEATVVAGEVRLDGTDLLRLGERERRSTRGAQVAMVYQDPMTSLNPLMRVGAQIVEGLTAHGWSTADARARTLEVLGEVGLPSPRSLVRLYPHQLSGGMRQRVLIASAIAPRPKVLIADEPTTALDVSVQAQILSLLAELQEESRMGLVLITHDLGVAATIADRVAVMYAGRIVEITDADELFNRPVHPYTTGLFGSVPQMNGGGADLRPIPGSPPSLVAIPPGCPFHPRCPLAVDRCRAQLPTLENVSEGHAVACHLSQEIVNAR